MERRSPITLLTAFFTLLALSISFNACNRMSGDIEPQNSKSSVAKKDSYARMSTTNCSQFIESQMSQTQRGRAINLMGVDGGTNFDIAVNAAPNLTTSYVNNMGSIVYSYMEQITNAIRDGAADYTNTFCDVCTQTYSSYSLYSSINNYLGPIRGSIQSNSSLTTPQRDVLLKALSAYDDNFHYISGLIEENSDCFEDPYWYNNNKSAGSLIISGGGIVVQRGFFSGLGKTLKKIVNITATVLIPVLKYALIFAAYGYMVASFVVPPAFVTGLAVGAAIGGLIGIIEGFNECFNGQYVCIIYPCP